MRIEPAQVARHHRVWQEGFSHDNSEKTGADCARTSNPRVSVPGFEDVAKRLRRCFFWT
jgi:hypothetical protein